MSGVMVGWYAERCVRASWSVVYLGDRCVVGKRCILVEVVLDLWIVVEEVLKVVVELSCCIQMVY